jgi:hypothetical protein
MSGERIVYAVGKLVLLTMLALLQYMELFDNREWFFGLVNMAHTAVGLRRYRIYHS